MCSTTKVSNGFRFHVLPIVLSCRDRATAALSDSVLAIAAHHRQWTGAALSYKTGAIKGLHECLATYSGGVHAMSTATLLATTMILCMYSVSSNANVTSKPFNAKQIRFLTSKKISFICISKVLERS